MATIDPKDFRSALGQFATGVTIVTGADAEGPFGMTASSFNSVSLKPPLILWSLGVEARCYGQFMEAEYFVVHVLTAEQSNLSNHFASADLNDKFENIDWAHNDRGIPVLKGCAAHFECQTHAKHNGGDHVIFVGEVEAYKSQHNVEPLLFHGGRYRQMETQ